MRTHPMPIRTNRVATLMVFAGVAGAAFTFLGVLREAPPAADRVAATAHQQAASAEPALCKLARELVESNEATLQQNGRGLLKASDCKMR